MRRERGNLFSHNPNADYGERLVTSKVQSGLCFCQTETSRPLSNPSLVLAAQFCCSQQTPAIEQRRRRGESDKKSAVFKMSLLSHYGHRYKLVMTELSRNWVNNGRIYRRRRLEESLSFEGKVVIVTGGNRGIGRKISEILVQKKVHRLIIACRDVSLGQKAVDEIKSKFPESTSQTVVYKLDLSSKQSIREFANEIIAKEPQVDVLINNAGILCNDRKETADGFEMMIGVNYFGTVLLTFLLFDHLKAASSDPRIVFISSIGHTEVRQLKIDDLNWEKEKSFPAFQVYGHTKLALLLLVKNFAVKAKEKGVLAYAVDPGISKTDLGRDVHQQFRFNPPELLLRGGISRPSLRSVSESATSVLMPLSQSREQYDPSKYNTTDGAHQTVSPGASDQEMADKLWSLTSELLELPDMKNF
jgi:NAD(P)-dependent dehydrogenase (short-subunit alcohol dehydrogenase family)